MKAPRFPRLAAGITALLLALLTVLGSYSLTLRWFPASGQPPNVLFPHHQEAHQGEETCSTVPIRWQEECTIAAGIRLQKREMAEPLDLDFVLQHFHSTGRSKESDSSFDPRGAVGQPLQLELLIIRVEVEEAAKAGVLQEGQVLTERFLTKNRQRSDQEQLNEGKAPRTCLLETVKDPDACEAFLMALSREGLVKHLASIRQRISNGRRTEFALECSDKRAQDQAANSMLGQLTEIKVQIAPVLLDPGTIALEVEYELRGDPLCPGIGLGRFRCGRLQQSGETLLFGGSIVRVPSSTGTTTLRPLPLPVLPGIGLSMWTKPRLALLPMQGLMVQEKFREHWEPEFLVLLRMRRVS